MNFFKATFKKAITQLKKLSPKQIILLVIAALFVVWVSERLLRSGTFFGYNVKSNDENSVLQSEDGQQAKSYSCEQVTSSDVEEVLGSKATRIGGSFTDRQKPNFISVCSYKLSIQPTRNVTVLIRDSATDESAQSAMNDVKKRNKVEELEGYGDEAFFSPVARQLNVREGKRITTVTVSKPVDGSKKSNKDATIELFKKI